MKPTKFQSIVQEKIKQGNSLLLMAPTGLGKTFAVIGDIQEKFCKTVYAVPLRSLGSGIRKEISGLKRNGQPLQPVIHHGDTQESMLFSEEVIVTTYDQVVCAVPGLPLSLPLKAGHAVAGALLMSRLVLDEVHLAWGISDQALTILLAIIDFRQKLGLQTIVLTATLPTDVARLISEKLGLELIVAGENQTADDEGLGLREENREVITASIDLKGIKKKKGNGEESKQLDYTPLDSKLKESQSKRIYFANTVERLQETFDRLVASGMDSDTITVLHNRMPASQRTAAEERVKEQFGKDSGDGDWLLLTNQVAEAGLDISGPRVISDPAPVDTLVQRAGRCARWFRKGKTRGDFYVIKVPKAQLKDWTAPYREGAVDVTLKAMPNEALSWKAEQEWVDNAWGLQKQPKDRHKERKEQIENKLTQTAFALNLFDRAAQNQKPGEIASVFREIISVEVAVEDSGATCNLQELLDSRKRPETSSVSLGRAWQLLRSSRGKAKIIRYEEGNLHIVPAPTYVQVGDVLIVPSTVAYLHKAKGLCFRKNDSRKEEDEILSSEWIAMPERESNSFSYGIGHGQSLLEHAAGVMEGTFKRLKEDGVYRSTLIKILRSLEPGENTERLADIIAQIAALAAGFHDLGKADRRWQAKVRKIDPESPEGELICRTMIKGPRIGIPHTPPGYHATIETCKQLLGSLNSSEHLIRSIALAAARHHSALLNPANVAFEFEPHDKTEEFVAEVLSRIGASEQVKSQVIIEASKKRPSAFEIPLLLPNDDLFPIYALVGRAILMADREDAAGKPLDQWGASS